MLGFQFTRKGLKVLTWTLMAVSAVGSLYLFVYWPVARSWISDAEPVLKLLGYVIAPLFAVVGFLTTRLDKIELVEEAGKAEVERERARLASDAAKAARIEAEEKGREAKRLLDELKGITTGADQLWKLRPARPFPNYREYFNERVGAVVVTIGNLKGGVGKTTIAGNFAAYVSETLRKRVLVVDLDYQASLSNLLLQALGQDEIGANVTVLFDPQASLAEVLKARTHLVPLTDEIAARMSRGWLVPSGYEYSTLENRLLLAWLLNRDENVDVRYRLAHSLLHPSVRQDYDLILLDMPPRMTLGAINAFVASHYFFVPTVLDKLSVEAVPQFLSNVRGVKEDLQLGVDLAGVIGSLTRQDELSANEQLYWSRAEEAGWVWSKGHDYRISRTLPRRATISDAAGIEIAYLHSDGTKRRNVREIMDPLFSDMAKRIGLVG